MRARTITGRLSTLFGKRTNSAYRSRRVRRRAAERPAHARLADSERLEERLALAAYMMRMPLPTGSNLSSSSYAYDIVINDDPAGVPNSLPAGGGTGQDVFIKGDIGRSFLIADNQGMQGGASGDGASWSFDYGSGTMTSIGAYSAIVVSTGNYQAQTRGNLANVRGTVAALTTATRTGTPTAGNPTVTIGGSGTAALTVGMPVTGTGIPADTRIVAKNDGANQVTLNNAPTQGDGATAVTLTFTENTPANRTLTAITVRGATNLVFETLTVGQTVRNTAGTVTRQIANILSDTSVELDLPFPSGSEGNQSFILGLPTTGAQAGAATLATGSNVLTNVNVNLLGIDVGRFVTGPGIPANTFVTAVNAGAGTVTLSSNALITGARTLRFTVGAWGDVIYRTGTGTYRYYLPQENPHFVTGYVSASSAGTFEFGRYALPALSGGSMPVQNVGNQPATPTHVAPNSSTVTYGNDGIGTFIQFQFRSVATGNPLLDVSSLQVRIDDYLASRVTDQIPQSFTVVAGTNIESRLITDFAIAGSTTNIDSPVSAANARTDFPPNSFMEWYQTIDLESTTVNVNQRLTANGLMRFGRARESNLSPIYTVLLPLGAPATQFITVNAPVEASGYNIVVAGSQAGTVTSRGQVLVADSGSFGSAAGGMAGSFQILAFYTDLRYFGPVRASQQVHRMEAFGSLEQFEVTTLNPTTGTKTGELQADMIVLTLSTPQGGQVDLKTRTNTFRFDTGTAGDVPYNYSVAVDNVQTTLLTVDAVASSTGPISLKTAGPMTIAGAAVQTVADIALESGGTLTVGAVSSAHGLVSLVAPTLALTGQVLSGGLDAVSLTSSTGGVSAAALVRAGGVVRRPVRAASETNYAFGTDLENGDAFGGVTLATGDRILLKNQTDGRENGVFVVQATGAPVRATDANTNAAIQSGMNVPVLQGTQQGVWTYQNTGATVLGTTRLNFIPATTTLVFAPVVAATTADITLSGAPKTIDTVAVTDGQRVLVKNQNNTLENGIYIARAGAWERASDADSPEELRAGGYVLVTGGATQPNSAFALNQDVASVDNSPVTFSPFTVQNRRTNPWSPIKTFANVALATTVNIDLATGGLLTIDGVVTTAGQRILVKNQLNAAENGIYTVVAGNAPPQSNAWTRVGDMPAGANGIARDSAVYAEGGAANSGTTWQLNDAIRMRGAIVANTPSATGLVPDSGLVVGMLVTGPGIPANTTIQSLGADGTSLTLSANATFTGTVALSFVSTGPVTVGTDPLVFIPFGGAVNVTAATTIGGNARYQGGSGLFTAGTAGPATTNTINVQTNVGRVSAAAPGPITIANNAPLEVALARTTADGDVTVTADGTLGVLAIQAAAGANTRPVTLTSTFGDIAIQSVEATRGNIVATSLNGNVSFTKIRGRDVNVTALSGSVSATADLATATITVDGRVLAQGTGSDVILSSNLGGVRFTADAEVTAADQLRIVTPNSTPAVTAGAVITAGRLSLTSRFGGSTTFSPALGTYQVVYLDRTDSGNLSVTAPSSLTVEGALTADGSVTISAPDVRVTGPVLARGASTSDVSITGSAGNVIIDAVTTSQRDVILSATGEIGGSVTQTALGTLAAGSATVTGLASTAGLAVGMRVAETTPGGRLPANVFVVSIDSPTQITLSAAATGAGTNVNLTFTSVTALVTAPRNVTTTAASAARLSLSASALTNSTLSAASAFLGVTDSDGLFIGATSTPALAPITFTLGGTAAFKIGTSAAGGSAKIGKVDTGVGGAIVVSSYGDIVPATAIDAVFDIRANAATLRSETGRIESETAIQSLTALASQNNQSISIADLDGPLDLVSVGSGSAAVGVNIAVSSQGSLTATNVLTGGRVTLSTSDAAADILINQISAAGNVVDLRARGSILEAGTDPAADVVATSVRLTAVDGGITAALNVSEASVDATTLASTVVLTNVGNLALAAAAARTMTVTAGGQVTQTAPIRVDNLTVTSTTGANIVLDAQPAAPVRPTGTTATNSDTITVLSSTAGLAVGMLAFSADIPTNRVITEINAGASSVRLDSGTGVSASAAQPITFVMPVVRITGVTQAAPDASTLLLDSTAKLAVGMLVIGPNVPLNTVITNVEAGRVTLSLPATGPGPGTFSFVAPAERLDGIRNNNAIVTSLASTANLVAGMLVIGTGIPDNTVIQSIDSATQITLSRNASIGNGPITFLGLTNQIGTFSASSSAGSTLGSISMRDARGGLVLGSVVGGVVTVTSHGDGDITQTGVINATSLSVTSSRAQSIVLNSQDNLVGTFSAVSLDGATATRGSISLKDTAGGLVLGTVTGGTVDILSTGNAAITQSGVIDATRFTIAGNGTDVLLDTKANLIGTFAATNGLGRIAIKDTAGGLDLAGIIGGAVTVTTSGNAAVTQSGAIEAVTLAATSSTGQDIALIGSRPAVAVTGTSTQGSSEVTLTSGATTAGLSAGMLVVGPGVQNNTVILAPTSPTTLELSLAADTGAGNGTFRVVATVARRNGTTTPGSATVTITGVGGTANLAPGMLVIGSGIPTNRVIVEVNATLNTVTLNDGTGVTASANQPLTFLDPASRQTGTINVPGNTVTGLTSTALLAPGMLVIGAGIPSNTVVLTVDSATQVTLTPPAGGVLVAGTGPITFLANNLANKISTFAASSTGGSGGARGAITLKDSDGALDVAGVTGGTVTITATGIGNVTQSGVIDAATLDIASTTAGDILLRGSNPPIRSTGTSTDNSLTVTLTSTTGLAAGMFVVGPGVPANTVIATVATLTPTITLSARAGAGAGAGTFNFVAPAARLLGNTAQFSSVVTGLPDTSGLAVGMLVMGAGIPDNTVVLSIDTTTRITLSATAVAGAAFNAPITFFSPASRQSGTVNVPANTVTGLASTALLIPGMIVVGAGIPSNTVVLTVDSATQVTLTPPAGGVLVAGTGPITFLANNLANTIGSLRASSVSGTGRGGITVKDTAAGLAIAGITGGTVTVTSSGNAAITQTGGIDAVVLDVSSTTAQGIVLNDVGNKIGTFTGFSVAGAVRGNVSLRDSSGGLVVAGIVGQSVTIASTGDAAITQTAAIEAVNLDVSSTLGKAITLDHAGNKAATFTAMSTAAGPPAAYGAITFKDSDGSLTLNSISGGTISIEAPGAITVNQAITAGNGVPLGAAGDGSITVKSNDANIVINNTLTALQDTITLEAKNGLITNPTPVPNPIQSKTFVWYAKQTFNGGNGFQIEGPNLTAAGDLVRNRPGLSFSLAAASTIDGNISVTAGSVTLLDLVKAGGQGKFVQITADTLDVVFDQLGRIQNDGGNVSITAQTGIAAAPGRSETLPMVAAGATPLATGILSLTSGGAGANLTTRVTALDAAISGTGSLVIAEADGIDLGSVAPVTTAGGPITVTTTAGSIVVAKNVTAGANSNVALTAGGTGSINGAGLVTAATVDLDATTGIGNSTALSLAAATISADTTNGTIDIDNALASAVTVTSLTTGAGSITFDQTGGGAATFTTVTTANGLVDLEVAGGNLTVGASVTAGGTGRSVLLKTSTSGNVLLWGTTTAAGDTVTVTSAGSINGAGLVTAATVDLDATTGIGNSTALSLAAATISADTTNGTIDIDNALASAVTVTSLTTGAGSITFDQTGGGAATFTTVATTDGLVDLEVAGGNLTVGASVTAGGTGTNVLLKTSTSGNILLTGTTTALGDTVTVTSAGNINGAGLVRANALRAGAVNGASLTTDIAVLDAEISDTGNLTVTNNRGLTIGSSGPVATVNGSATFIAAGPVIVARDTAARGPGADLTIQGTRITLDADVSADDQVILIVNPGPIDGNGRVLAGTFTITANGDLTVSTLLVVTTLHIVGDGGTIVVDNPLNDVQFLSVRNTVGGTPQGALAGSVTYRDANGFDLLGARAAAITLLGGGSLTQSGAIVAGTLAANTSAGNLSLTNPANDVGSAAFSNPGRDISYVDANALAIAAAGIQGGSVSIVTGGDLTQVGTVTASALAVMSNGGTIALDTAPNAVGVLTANNAGRPVAFQAAGGLVVGAAGIVGGNVALSVANDLTQDGAITAGNLMVSNSGGRVVLGSQTNAVGTLTIANPGRSVTFRDMDALGIAAAGIQGADIALIANGDITQSGPVIASRLAITNTAGAVTLSHAINNVGSVAIANGNRAVSYRDADAVAVAAAGIQGGAVSLTAGGDLTQAGLITATSLDVVNSGGGVSLGSLANPVSTVAIANAGRAVAFRTAGALGIGAAGIQAGSLVLTAGGNVAQGGAVTTGTFQLNATGAGAVDLRAAGNAFSVLDANIGPAMVSLANAAPLTINAIETLNIGSVIVTGNVRVNTPGNLVVSPVGDGLLRSSTQLDLRGVQGDIQLLNRGRLEAPQILIDGNVPIQVGDNVTTPTALDAAVEQVNTLPQIPGTIYEIIVSASMTIARTLSFQRPVQLKAATPGTTLSGSAQVPDGVIINSGASGTRITNLAFAGFSGTAVRVASAKNVAITGIQVSGSGTGTGLWISGDSTESTVRGSRFSNLETAIRLGESRTIGATGVLIGGRDVADRNVVEGARRAGVSATGFCSGTQLVGMTFTASPSTRVRFNVRNSRGLRIVSTFTERATVPQAFTLPRPGSVRSR